MKRFPKIIFIAALSLFMAAGCNPFSSNVQRGIVKTANGGSDWQAANKLTEGEGTLAGVNISRIMIDPRKHENVYASTYDNGLFISEDAGNSWRQILTAFGVYDFAVDPNNADVIYAAGIYANHGRVLATRDAGKSWVEVFNEASTQNPVRSIAVNPQNSADIIIGLGSGTLIKSQDAGTNWRLLKAYPDRINRVRWQANDVFVLVRNEGLFKSSNGGENFSNITTTLRPANNYSQLLISPAGVANFNQVAVSQSNSSTIYITTSNGLYRTVDSGNTWSFVALPLHQQGLQAYAIAIAPSTDNVVYTSVGPTIYKTSDGGNTWQAEDPHSEAQVVALEVHPQLPQQAFAGLYAE